MDGLDLNAVAAFVAVVEQRSFRGAAKAMGLPKSTVSRRVAELEARLGTQLLQRTTRTVSLTDAGEALHQRAGAALGAIHEAAREVHAEGGAPSGVLRVTAAVSFGENFLGPVVAEFVRAYPKVRVSIELTDRYVDLVREGFDLAFRAGALADSTLRARLLGTNAVGLVASPGYLAAHGTPKTPAELATHDCIAVAPRETGVKWSMLVRRRMTPVPVKVRVAVNSMPLARDLAIAGLGIARLPQAFSAEGEADGRLVRVLTEYNPPVVPLNAVFPPGAHPPPRVQAFLKMFMAHFDTVRPPSVTTKKR